MRPGSGRLDTAELLQECSPIAGWWTVHCRVIDEMVPITQKHQIDDLIQPENWPLGAPL